MRSGRWSGACGWALIVAFGLVVGVLTLYLESVLRGRGVAVLVNSVSPWLVPSFVAGALLANRGRAMAAGLVVCLMEVVGYYGAEAVRGWHVGLAIAAFWTVCALVGGPALGAGGHLWRTGRHSLRGLGAALLSGAFVAEGLWVYGLERHADRIAVLYLAIGALLGLGLSRTWIERRWLALVVPLGIAAEMALGQVYAHSF